MTRATCGMLIGMIGSAIGVWMWSRQFSERQAAPRGTVIYRNTPTPAEGE
jgi:hypothetical protein